MNSLQTSLRLKERLAYKILMLKWNGQDSQASFLKEAGKRLVKDKFDTSIGDTGVGDTKKSKSTRNYYNEDKFWEN